jgi:hypothetical protein
MISTALAIQDATKQAVMHDVTVFIAKDLFDNKNEMDKDEFSKAIFNYSAHLASLTATLVMEACLTKSQLNEMMDTVKEMQSMGKDLDNE